MSFIVVQESLGDLLPRTWKMLGFFFFFFLLLCFFPLKEEKTKQCVTGRGQGWAESCHRKGGITATLLHFPTCLLPPHNLSWRQGVKSELLLCWWCLQGLLPTAWLPKCHNARVAESFQSFCCLSEELAGSLQMKAENKLLGFLPGMSLDFLYFPFFFSCMLRCSALCSNTVLPLCWPPSVGNSSECPPPGNAPDDTVCVDMGKCKDGECVPFCEREKNLRSCACNGGWHRTELKCVLQLCSSESAGLTLEVVCWRAQFLVSEKA